MANTKVEIIGGQLDGAVLSNAASEATLKELVNAINGMSGKGGKSGRGGGGGGPMGGGGSRDLNKAQKELENQTSALSKMFKGAGNTIKGMTQQVIANNTSMSTMASTINDNLLKNIPVLGKLLGGLGDIVVLSIDKMEAWNEQLKISSSYGASFNNNIFEMRKAAAESNMELEEFVSLIRDNRHELAAMGGTVTKGALAFKDLAHEYTKAGGVGQSLIDMGYSSEQANRAMLRYITTVQATGKVGKDTLTNSVAYQMSLEKLAKLTGKTVKEQEDALAKTQNDLAYRYAKSKLTADAQAKLELGNIQAQRFGAAGAARWKEIALGLPPMTEETRAFAAANQAGEQALQDLSNGAKNSAISTEQYQDYANKVTAKGIAGTNEAFKNMSFALSAGSAGMEGITGLMYKNFTEILDPVTKTADGFDITADNLEKQAKAAKTETESRDAMVVAMNRFTQAINNISKLLDLTFVNALEGVVTWLTNELGAVGDFLVKFGGKIDNVTNKVIIPMLQKIPAALTKFTEWLGNAASWMGDAITAMWENIGLEISYAISNSMIGKLFGMKKMSEEEYNAKKESIRLTKEENDANREKIRVAQEQQKPTAGKETEKTGSARASIEKYLGRKISDTEYNQLIKATHAESSGGKKADPKEQALIMGSILNRARDLGGDDSITKALYAKNQFQSVTGTRANGHRASENYLVGPNGQRQAMIEGAAVDYLNKVSKDQKNFTAAATGAYGAGTNIGYRDDMIRKGGSVVGGTVFQTAPGFASGTLGTLGKTFGDFGSGTAAMLHGREAVMTESQYTDTIKTTAKTAAQALMGSGAESQIGMGEMLSTLNNNIVTLINVNRASLEVHNRQLKATKGLSGDLFQIA